MTYTDRQLEVLAERLRAEDLILYLERHGWTRGDAERQEVLNYIAPVSGTAGRQVRVLVPATDELDDFAEMAYRTAHAVAVVEQRSVSDVIIQLTNLWDILKAQVASNVTTDGTISIGGSLSLTRSIHDLLVYSVSSEITGATDFKRKLKAAIKYADTCRVGQSELGSYVSTFLLPLPRPPKPRDQDDLFPADPAPPYQRRAAGRIMRGLHDVDEALTARDYRIITDNSELGLNANMCDAVSTILGNFPDGVLTFSITFDPVWRVPDVPERVVLRPAARSLVDRASAEMRDVPIAREVELIASVFQLRHEGDIGGGNPHEVRLEWEDKGNYYKIRVTLTPEEYEAACKAHIRGQMVKLIGNLEKIGRDWYLHHPSGFEVLDNS